MTREFEHGRHLCPPPVITGLVPVISIMWSAAFHRIGMAGTGPAMTAEGVGPGGASGTAVPLHPVITGPVRVAPDLDRSSPHIIIFTFCSSLLRRAIAMTSASSSSPPPSSRPPSADPSPAALSSPDPAAPDGPAPSPIRDKLPPERVALMRDWVECTGKSFKRIGRELGVSASTISRYAAEGGWKRPTGAAPPPRIALPNPEPARRRADAPVPAPEPDGIPPALAARLALRSAGRTLPPGQRREQIVERLWALAERQAEVLETQPIERAERALQPLARLTRTLGEIDKHVRPPLPAHEDEAEAPKPRRTLHELRDELAAHLERIQREEGYGWEVREWWFSDGGGI